MNNKIIIQKNNKKNFNEILNTQKVYLLIYKIVYKNKNIIIKCSYSFIEKQKRKEQLKVIIKSYNIILSQVNII